ncbi:hypothetical protein CHELA20_10892 [Hyphomicrobiales bacterium]|nr:hypothetical protein CHELA20_10892 [Hyphomicrobiales bacterium]
MALAPNNVIVQTEGGGAANAARGAGDEYLHASALDAP